MIRQTVKRPAKRGITCNHHVISSVDGHIKVRSNQRSGDASNLVLNRKMELEGVEGFKCANCGSYLLDEAFQLVCGDRFCGDCVKSLKYMKYKAR